MEPDRWRRLEEIFFAGLERGPEERARLLAEAEGMDPELAREAAAMLAAHDASEPPAVERLLLAAEKDEGAVQLLRAGFDGIMAAALQETPAQRRPTAPPVPARAGSLIHRAGRATVAALLLGGLLLADSGPVRPRRVETVTRRPAATAPKVSAIVKVSDPGKAQGGTVPAHGPLDRGTKRVHTQVTSQPAAPPDPETSRLTAP